MTHITQALIDEAVAYCLTGRRPPFTVHEIQQLLNAWQERDTLRAQLAAAEARAERLEKELRQIYDWARVEKAPLRPGEIQSIERALNESAALAEGEAG